MYYFNLDECLTKMSYDVKVKKTILHEFHKTSFC